MDELDSFWEEISNEPWPAFIKRLISAKTNKLISAPRTLRNRIRYAYQRSQRGWDDTALWNLDKHLAQTLGAQLIQLSVITHSYPDGYPNGSLGWCNDLRLMGAVLVDYANTDDHEYESLDKNAQKALHWVAANFPSLWD